MTIYILEVMKSAMAAGKSQEKATEWILNGHCIVMILKGRVILTSKSGWLLTIIQITANWNSIMRQRESKIQKFCVCLCLCYGLIPRFFGMRLMLIVIITYLNILACFSSLPLLESNTLSGRRFLTMV